MKLTRRHPDKLRRARDKWRGRRMLVHAAGCVGRFYAWPCDEIINLRNATPEQHAYARELGVRYPRSLRGIGGAHV